MRKLYFVKTWMTITLVLVGTCFSTPSWGDDSCERIATTSTPLHRLLMEGSARVPTDASVFNLHVNMSDIDRGHDSDVETAFEHGIEKARQIANWMYQADPLALTRLKTMLYPAAGFDGATPFILSPETETVIALDDHPFALNLDSPRSARIGISQIYQYANYIEVDNASASDHIPEVLVGRLALAIPGFRLRQVQAIRIQNRGGHREPSEYINGLIEFDTGDATPIRRYVHIHLASASRHALPYLTSEMSQLLKRLQDVSFDGLLAKASMEFFKFPESRYAEKTLGTCIAKLIYERNGSVIDCDGLPWPWLSAENLEVLLENRERGQTIQMSVTSGTEANVFGYAEEVRWMHFRRP